MLGVGADAGSSGIFLRLRTTNQPNGGDRFVSAQTMQWEYLLVTARV